MLQNFDAVILRAWTAGATVLNLLGGFLFLRGGEQRSNVISPTAKLKEKQKTLFYKREKYQISKPGGGLFTLPTIMVALPFSLRLVLSNLPSVV